MSETQYFGQILLNLNLTNVATMYEETLEASIFCFQFRCLGK